MAQILVLYNSPADPAAFDKYYFESHAPIARKIPGLRGMHFSKTPPMAIMGSAPHLVVRLDFDSMADLQAALMSPGAGDRCRFGQFCPCWRNRARF